MQLQNSKPVLTLGHQMSALSYSRKWRRLVTPRQGPPYGIIGREALLASSVSLVCATLGGLINIALAPQPNSLPHPLSPSPDFALPVPPFQVPSSS